MTAEEKRRDASYRKNFGITLDDYNTMLVKQGGVCAVCGNPPKENKLSVEHCHQWKYVKIHTEKNVQGDWVSIAAYRNQTYKSWGQKKNQAIQFLREQLKLASIRGLTCFPCNSAIRSIRNNAEFAQRLAEYLRKHQNAN